MDSVYRVDYLIVYRDGSEDRGCELFESLTGARDYVRRELGRQPWRVIAVSEAGGRAPYRYGRMASRLVDASLIIRGTEGLVEAADVMGWWAPDGWEDAVAEGLRRRGNHNAQLDDGYRVAMRPREDGSYEVLLRKVADNQRYYLF